MERLSKAKTESSEATEHILKEADNLLTKTIPAIIDKDKPAPSGDKHDYISSAPCWRPDPENPAGPYIRKDDVTNKDAMTQDKKLGTMANSIVQLSLAYNLTSNEKQANKAVKNLRIWFQNPRQV